MTKKVPELENGCATRPNMPHATESLARFEMVNYTSHKFDKKLEKKLND